jgi:hypothetical protein
MNPLPEYLHIQLEDELRARRVVVWYDPEREFEPFVAGLERKSSGVLPKVLVGGLQTALAIYNGSFFALRLEVEPFVESEKPEPLLIYVPGEHASEKGSPLKELECAGKLYERTLSKVAKTLLKRTYTEGTIDEMFRDRKLGYDDICRLLEPGNEGETSILKLVLGELDAPSMVAKWLSDTSTDKEIENKGGRSELIKLVALKCGLALPETDKLSDHRDQLCRFLLLNEFRQDLTCPEPPAIAMVPRAALKDQRAFISRVLDGIRKNCPALFEMVADSVEQEFSLATAGISAEALGSIDTFRFEEQSMLVHAGGLIATGRYAAASKIVEEHRRSFWAMQDLSRRQIQWELCATLAELGSETSRVLGELKTTSGGATVFVERYTTDQGWHRMDALHRRLEAQIARMQDEPTAEQAVALVRAKTEDVLRTMADAFGAALESDKWSVNRTLHQTQIFPQKVSPLPGKVAWFHVDAMRFEMAGELARQLSEAVETELTPAVAVLPSITPLCMAALLPGASASYAVVEYGGKAAARIGTTVLSDVADRMSYLKAQVPDAGDVTLEKVLQVSTAKLQSLTAGVRLLVVRSQEIDSLGEKHELLARQLMDTVIGNLARAVRKLAALGYERFVITADHGHQFSSRKDDDMKVDAPAGKTVELHRRCWIGQGPAIPVGAVRVTGADLGYDSPLEFVFPQGLGVFKAGGGLSYHHGGFTLQELIIPVLTFRMPQAAKQPAQGAKVKLSKDFQVITNRTFVVNVEMDADLVSPEPVRLRVVLVNKGEEVGYVGLAPGSEFKSEDKILTLAPGKRASVVMLLTKEGVDSISILAQDAGSPAVYAEIKSIPVKLKS